MATAKQIELFRKLTQDRQFPANTNLPALRDQFGELSDTNASGWIEKALELPKVSADAEAAATVPAPF